MNRLIILLSLLLVPVFISAQTVVTIEAASPDPTLTVRGLEKQIDLFNNPVWEKQEKGIVLLSTEYQNAIKSTQSIYTAVIVNKDMKVTKVLNGVISKNIQPVFKTPLDIELGQAEFALIGYDADYSKDGYRKFLAENFHVGDVVKLRINGEIHSLDKVIAFSQGSIPPQIELDNDFLFTVVGSKTTLSGCIANYDRKAGYQLFIESQTEIKPVPLTAKGLFHSQLTLNNGTNFFNWILKKGGKEITRKPVVVFSKAPDQQQSELVMWVEQFPNAKVVTNREAVTTMVNNVKKAGFTSIGLDVKGPEGYVSYRKNDLSKTPYLTATKNPNKQVKDDGFDLLEVVLQEAHKIGLKVYTSFNFFTEGNITVNDYAILHEHKDWEEIVQRPEDKGKLLKITESTRGKEAAKGKLLALAFVNPSNKEVQDFQLLRVEEVLKNYDIDGIVLDRCRYDNLYADFSHVTRNAFEEYLEKEGEVLENFPADAFRINKEGVLIKGKFFKEWITFRSQTICDFTNRIRLLVDKYKVEKNPDLKMAAYVGSWYEVYYQNGVNWASNQFKYDDRLSFPDSEIYGKSYNRTSYLGNLDFLMIGTYYKTPKEVNRYITLGNILTCGQVPLLGSMSLPDLSVSDQGKVFGASLKNSSGLMIFDNCYVDWETFFEQMKIAFSIKKK